MHLDAGTVTESVNHITAAERLKGHAFVLISTTGGGRRAQTQPVARGATSDAQTKLFHRLSTVYIAATAP